MNTYVLSKPTAYNFFLGRICSIVKNRFPRKQYEAPRKIGKYTFKKAVIKPNNFQDYTVGIYTYRKEKFFIKTWQGNIKDLEYYLLINEYINASFFVKKLRNISDGSHSIYVSKPLEIIREKNSLSAVFAYIEGKNLETYPAEKQITVTIEVQKAFKELTDSLTEKERAQFSQVPAEYYILALPLLFLLISMRSLKVASILLRKMIPAIRALLLMRNTPMLLAHRDLMPGNIIMSSRKVYVVDLAHIVLTIPYYDESLLAVDMDTSKNKQYSMKGKNAAYQSVKIYILAYLAACFILQKPLFEKYATQIYEK